MRLMLFFSFLALAACGEPIKVNPPPPPERYMVCAELPAKPDLEPLRALTLADGREVYLKRSVDARDAKIATYVVEVRGAWFSCSNQLETLRDYYREVE